MFLIFFFDQGTLVAGVIAANTTGITQTQYATEVPFIGVAPQATLGAYRIFGCSGTTSSGTINISISNRFVML